MAEYLMANPLAMVGVFLAFVSAPLVYEAVLYLRTRGKEAEIPAPAPVLVDAKPARKRGRY